MSIQEARQRIVKEFNALPDWDSRYQRLIELGAALNSLAAEQRSEKYLIKGCQSQVWLHARLEEGRVRLSGDSDALIVKGLVALVLAVYNNQTPADILADDAGFIGEIGLSQHLSPVRSNGLLAMLKQIRMYALAWQAVVQKGAQS